MSETTKVFQINFEAMAIDLAKENNEMKNVLAWASENVWSIRKWENGEWSVYWSVSTHFTKPTLYQALYTAWENREK